MAEGKKKVSDLDLLKELEKAVGRELPRGKFNGIVGYITPGYAAAFVLFVLFVLCFWPGLFLQRGHE